MGNELVVAQYEASQTRSAWWKVQSVLFAPKAAFQEVDREPNWFLPLMLVTVLSIASWVVSVQRIGLDTMARAQMQSSGQWEHMSPEARGQAIEMSEGMLMQIIGYVPVSIGPAFLLVVISAAFLFAFSLAGVDAPFRKWFAVSAHAMFGYALLTTALTIVVLLVAKNPKALDVNNLVQTNLGFLADAREAPVLTAFLRSLDVLTFYAIYLLSVGSSVVSRRPLGSSLTVTITLWAIYVAGKLSLKALWS